MLEIYPAESSARFRIEGKVGFVTPKSLFSAPPSKPFRLIFLHDVKAQRLWNDILVKKRGVGVASTKGLTLRWRAHQERLHES